jgi:hypothetical protein
MDRCAARGPAGFCLRVPRKTERQRSLSCETLARTFLRSGPLKNI